MRYEVTLRLIVEAPVYEDRVTRQIESLFDFGAVFESLAEALKLNEAPHSLSVAVSSVSARTTTLG